MATQIGKLYAIIGLNTAEFDRKMKKVGQNMTKIGKTLTKRLTLPLIALGTIAVKVGADFEQSMANAASVCGATGEELEQMKDIAREMGMTTVYSAKQAGDAMYYMASAGWDVNKMALAIKPTLALAAATQSDLAFTTNTVVSTLNQFRLDVKDTEKVVDIYANAIANSQATLDKLGISMTYVGPIANSMGMDLKDTTSILMGLYNAGYDASKAGTALRMGFAKLMKGTKETQDALARLGLTLEDIDPTTHDFADTIDLLRRRGADAKDILEIFGVRAGPAMAALIGMGGDALREFRSKLDATGTAAKMQEIQIRTFQGSIKLLTSALSEVAIQIFDIVGPAIKRFIDEKIRPAVQWFSSLSRETKKLLIGFAAFVALIGPSLALIGSLTKAMAAASIATKTWSAAILVAYGAYKGLMALREAWEKKTGKWVDKEKQAWDTILEKVGGINGVLESAVKAHVITQKQHHELWEKFKLGGVKSAEEIREALRALAEGKEGAELAEFLKELGGAELEAALNADIHKASLSELKSTIEGVNNIIDEAIKKGEDWEGNVKDLIAKRLEQQRMEEAIAGTVKEMTDQIKQATLDEFSYRIWAAKETYKERKALLDKEGADKEAYVLLEKALAIALENIE
ncbi:MAG: phage tail tape measure protein, partial [Candidatus Aminicenantes bacterium]|nr:phage tail tape measure protein [Candidatus Aminicenantes bacterium]